MDRSIVYEQLDNAGHIFTRWPPVPIFSLYGPRGELVLRSRAASFDLTEALTPLMNSLIYSATFGIASRSNIPRKWTLIRLAEQEENIRYDLSEDGFDVDIERIKGIGLSCFEEAMWRLRWRSDG